MKTVARVLAFAALGGVTLAAAVPASATEKLPTPAYTVRYEAKTDRYCLRATDANEALRTGTRIYRPECKTQAAWAADGLQIARK